MQVSIVMRLLTFAFTAPRFEPLPLYTFIQKIKTRFSPHPEVRKNMSDLF